MRRSLVLVALAAIAMLPACTTSRAVRAWHAAEQARDRGDTSLALRRYEEAYARDGRLVGAEVDRIALLARDIGASASVEAARAALMEKKAGRVEVQLLAAGLELVAGRPKPAFEQLGGIGEVAVDKAEAELGRPGLRCGPLRRERLRLHLLAALQLGRGRDAERTAAQLQQRCSELRSDEAALVATVALQRGDDAAAATALDRAADRNAPALRRVSASLALRRGDAGAALESLRGIEDGPGQVLRAQAALAAGDGVTAQRALAAARDAGVESVALQPLEGALALLQGDAQRGRDLLAGAAAAAGAGLRWTTLFDLGLCELRLGRLAAARDAFARAAGLCASCPAPAANRDAIDRALGRLP